MPIHHGGVDLQQDLNGSSSILTKVKSYCAFKFKHFLGRITCAVSFCTVDVELT